MKQSCSDESRRRTLIFGIDGGTWEALDPLIERDVMPCLGNLRERGAWGNLESVVPVNSASAWSSILTGVAPERHGIFDFLAWHPHKRKRTTVNASWLPRPTILDLMGQQGAVLSLKVPMTYPPWPVNGAIVSGLPTPDDESTFSYPKGLAKRLNPLIERGSAGRSWELARENRHHILDHLEAAHRTLVRMTDRLIEEVNPDVCFSVARDVDELQHFFWDVLSGDDEFGYLPRLEAYFAGLDRYLARMLDWAGSDGRIIVFSDHGFGPVEGIWHLNDWLRRKGFLRLKSDDAAEVESLALPRSIRINYAVRRRLLAGMKRLGCQGQRLSDSLAKLKLRGFRHADLAAVDWTCTLAYAGNVGEEWLPVYINLEGREPEGIVSLEHYTRVREDLRQTLEQNQDPVVLVVHRGEEIFDVEDPRLTDAPDLVVETLSGAVQSDFAFNRPEVFEKPNFRNGCHRRRGMYLLAGEDVRPVRFDADLLDIPATILAWQNIQPPDKFCGKVLSDLFAELSVPEPSELLSLNSEEKAYLSEKEEADVRKKLESLGYL
jgi:predicted AlkP superfamily phosphohydrolase/phosphomutase